MRVILSVAKDLAPKNPKLSWLAEIFSFFIFHFSFCTLHFGPVLSVDRAKGNAMTAIMMWMAVATLGIDVGWQRMPDGGMQYIIQIEPQTYDALVPVNRSKATSPAI